VITLGDRFWEEIEMGPQEETITHRGMGQERGAKEYRQREKLLAERFFPKGMEALLKGL